MPFCHGRYPLTFFSLHQPKGQRKKASESQETKSAQLLISSHINSENDSVSHCIKKSVCTATVMLIQAVSLLHTKFKNKTQTVQ